MIGQARTGTSFGGLSRYLVSQPTRDGEGLQDYLLGRGESAERVLWTATRNLPEDDPSRAALHMTATAAENARVKRPVYHLSISAPPGEILSRTQWEAVAERVLSDLGLERHQALLVAHGDKAHPHLHLMVNRVDPETFKAWSNSHDWARIERALRHVERELELREVPGHHHQLPDQERPERSERATAGEKRQEARTGEESWGRQVRFAVYNDFREATSYADLERRLAPHGLRLKPRGGGLVVTDGERSVKASRVYRRGSAGWLKKRFGLSYQDYRKKLEALRTSIDRLDKVEAARRRLEGRRRDLGERLRELVASGGERHQARRAAEEATRRLHRALADLYGPDGAAPAQAALARLAGREGWEHAWQHLAREPERFGKLQDPESERRQHSRRPRLLPGRSRRRRRSFGRVLARRAASAGRDWMLHRAAELVAGPAGFRLSADALFVERQIRSANRRLAALPSERDLMKDVAARTATLGFEVVRLVLAPRPMAAVRTAVKAAELARAVVRGRGR